MLHSNVYNYNSRNERSAMAYIDKLFTHHAKLLPVRIDLGYKSNNSVNQLTTMDNHLPHAYLTQENIMTNWTYLLNKLRWNTRGFLKELVGYMWKIEYGLEKGIHYHIMLFLNGNRVQKDYYYANELGKLWLDITNRQGTYFNCSVDKQTRYGNNNCLRVFHRDEERTNLYCAARYLTKIDDNEEIARQLSEGRVFGKGC